MPNKERTLAIDDCRECTYAHLVARTYQAGLEALAKMGPWETLFLDHDLGDDQPGTGYDILVFLRDNREYLPKRIVLITQNPVGRKNMKAVLIDIEKGLTNGPSIPPIDVHPLNVIPSVEQKPKIGLKITEMVRDIVNLGGKVLFTKDRGGDSMTLYVDKFSPHSHLGQPDGGSKMLEKHLIASLSQALEEAKKHETT